MKNKVCENCMLKAFSALGIASAILVILTYI